MKDKTCKPGGRLLKVAIYFCVFLAVGVAAAVVASVFMPTIKIDAPSPNTTGIRAYLAIGAIFAVLIVPVFAGFRHWEVLSYLIASTFAVGLLFANVGFGIPLSILSVIILYGVQWLHLILMYFRPAAVPSDRDDSDGQVRE